MIPRTHVSGSSSFVTLVPGHLMLSDFYGNLNAYGVRKLMLVHIHIKKSRISKKLDGENLRKILGIDL